MEIVNAKTMRGSCAQSGVQFGPFYSAELCPSGCVLDRLF